MGPGGLNDRVRNGIGWGTPGIVTSSTNTRDGAGADTEAAAQSRDDEDVAWEQPDLAAASFRSAGFDKNDQADRTISTGKLHGSLRFHTRPINVVVYHGPQRSLVSRWVSRLDAFSGYPVHT